MNAGASTYAVPSPIEGPGTAWVLLGSWALSPARPTPIHPRHECRGFSALLVTLREHAPRCLPLSSKNTDEGFTKWTSSLYERLGCQRQPRAQHIIIHLTQLRGRGRPPARPEVLYPGLLEALMSEGKKATAHERDPILWAANDYHRPCDVLLGAKHQAIFE